MRNTFALFGLKNRNRPNRLSATWRHGFHDAGANAMDLDTALHLIEAKQRGAEKRKARIAAYPEGKVPKGTSKGLRTGQMLTRNRHMKDKVKLPTFSFTKPTPA